MAFFYFINMYNKSVNAIGTEREKNVMHTDLMYSHCREVSHNQKKVTKSSNSKNVSRQIFAFVKIAFSVLISLMMLLYCINSCKKCSKLGLEFGRFLL